ncbi:MULTISPECIES: hypothetical protein [Streptomyces]|uniref:hypothetical protein n=2 Tax=Streptomyces TaxID=1883 RepID=UPI00225B0B9B|nr:hypothetical protein [Streptomyces sp. NBC_00160]MCX5308168.1 hypothetical protein [Streptomyces sp. NBC_00160]
MQEQLSRAHGQDRRREAGARSGQAGGMTLPQAAVVCVVLVLAVVMRLYGQMPMAEIFQLLAGAAGISALIVVTVTPGGRGKVAAAVRGFTQAGR